MRSVLRVLAPCSAGVGARGTAWGWRESLSLESWSLIQKNDRAFLEQVGITQAAY